MCTVQDLPLSLVGAGKSWVSRVWELYRRWVHEDKATTDKSQDLLFRFEYIIELIIKIIV